MARSNPLAEAALSLAARGWAVFPIGRNKVPLTAHGFKDATTDFAKVQEFWERLPHANIAVATGSASGLTVIDVDGPAGEESLQALRSLYGWPETLEARSGRAEGGRHFYFKDGDLACPSGKLGVGIDVKGEGGCIIAPPSIHESRISYAWANSLEPVDLPTWVPMQLGRTTVGRTNLDGSIRQGERNDTLFKIAASMRRAGMSQDEIEAALLQINRSRCEPPFG